MKAEEHNSKASPNCLEVNDGKDCTVWTVNNQLSGEKIYTYDEAIDLTGNGCYIYTLVLVGAFAYEGMALDMFGVSIVVSSACDLELTENQKKILLSMPFLGSVIMSYPWGYFIDTQGRLKSLIISLWGSFILASLSAFSPNWIILAVLRLSSTSFGIQSLVITLIGESSSSKLKGSALIAVTTLLYYTFLIYSVCAYFILSLEFAFDLGFIVFTPWRLLTMVLALPLGISALFSFFFCESPKYLLNAGNEKRALKVLREISERNGVEANKYPVRRVVLNETSSLRRDIPILQSLMEQIIPLFKPPLLYRSIQLFFIIAVIYSTNNGFYAWLPLVADKLNSGYNDNITNENFCKIFINDRNLNKTSTCLPKVTEFTLWISLILGVAGSLLNVVVSWLSFRKKSVLMALLLTSSTCGVFIPLVPGMILGISLFYGLLFNGIGMSIIFSYYVDMFPTSFCGMAACLGVMVARISAVIGTNLVGTYLVSHCSTSFYCWSAFTICGVIMSIFLPPDKSKKLN